MFLFVYKIVFFVAILWQVASAQQCFFPDGTSDPDGVVCNVEGASSSSGSACCRAGDVCKADGTCEASNPERSFGPPKQWYRQSCTDQSFQASACARNCTSDSAQPNTSIWILPCDASIGECCWAGTSFPTCDTRCNPMASMFANYRPSVTQVVTVTAVPTASPAITTMSTITSGGAAVDSSSASTPTSTSTSPPIFVGGDSQSQSQLSDSRNASSSRTVGLAVGLSLGIILILSFIGFFLYHRRRKHSGRSGLWRHSVAEMPAGGHPQELPQKEHADPAEMDEQQLPPYMSPKEKIPIYARPLPVHELPGSEVMRHEMESAGPDDADKKFANLTTR